MIDLHDDEANSVLHLDASRRPSAENFTKPETPGIVISLADKRDERAPRDILERLVKEYLAKHFSNENTRLRAELAAANDDLRNFREKERAAEDARRKVHGNALQHAEARVTDLKKSHERQVGELRSRLEKQEEAHDVRTAELKQSYGAQIAELKQSYRAQLDHLKEVNEVNAARLDRVYGENLARLDQAFLKVERLYEERVAELRTQIRQVLKAPKATVKEQLERLRSLVAKR